VTAPPLSSTETRAAWSAYLCDTDLYVRVSFPGDGKVWDLLVAEPAAPAFEALAACMSRHGELFRESAGGTYNCREIAGSGSYSLHAYGLAIDINPSKNPQGSPVETEFSAAFVADAKAIRTVSGRYCFQWGGDWSASTPPDPMHFQIGATPAEIGTGVIDPGGDDMPLSEADLASVRDVVRDEIKRATDPNNEATSQVSRSVWAHGGVFDAGGDDPDTTAGLTLRRAATIAGDLQGGGVKLTRSEFNYGTLYAGTLGRVPGGTATAGSSRRLIEDTADVAAAVAPPAGRRVNGRGRLFAALATLIAALLLLVTVLEAIANEATVEAIWRGVAGVAGLVLGAVYLYSDRAGP
jgi:hypothetical protein